MKGEISSQKQRIDNLVTQHAQQFSDAQQERIRVFNEKLEQAMGELEQRSSEIIEILEEKREEASNLVQVIGITGTTGNYKRIANAEGRTADHLRWGAIFFMILMVVVVGSTVFFRLTNGVSWDVAIYRILAGLIFVVPAGYLAFESAHHRKIESRTRRIELELASLDPFMEKLDGNKNSELREELARKYFGNADDKTEEMNKVSPTNLLDLFHKLLELLNKKA